MGARNYLYYPSKAMSIGSCRAYFKLTTSASVKSCVLNFDEDDATSIDGAYEVKNIYENWYDLNGRKLSGKPTQRGIYIHNGRKEVLR